MSDVEALWIKIKLNARKVPIGGIYRPPRSPVDILDKLKKNCMGLKFTHKGNIMVL